MKKKLLLFFCVATVLSTYTALAQVTDSSARWTWMAGANTGSTANVRGTQGQEAATNVLGAKNGAVSWVDASGNFWLFGGQNANNAYSNDLWKYNRATKLWTWIKGPGTENTFGVYGDSGVANIANTPGCRSAAVACTDASGNLWLYGGYGYAASGAINRLGDLWKYDPASNMWTWMSGSKLPATFGSYGLKGTAASTNVPGARSNPVMVADASGNFWLFGGYGFAESGAGGVLNDMWKYNITTGLWTYMAGLKTANGGTTYTGGVYGPAGAEDDIYMPGGRYGQSGCMDASGNFWIAGGGGTGSGNYLNDLWKFNTNTGKWAFMNGSATVNPATVYGTRGVANPANAPHGKRGHVMWIDVQGNIWTFGGVTGGTNTALNQLWKYDVALNQWIWEKGSTATTPTSVYGTASIQDVGNTPGGRYANVMWKDAAGNIWEWGGWGYGTSATNVMNNDLWLLSPPCTNTANVAVVNPTTFCAGDSVILIANAGTGYTYQWRNASTAISGATDDSLIVKAGGSYIAWVTSGLCTVASTATAATMNALPAITIAPATAVICAGKDTALTADGGTGYTWAPAGNGASFRAGPTTTTTYTVTGTDANGCKNIATRVVTVNTLPAITIIPATAVICTGNDTALTADGGISYTWAPAGSGTSFRANPTTTTTYTVTGTDANGCSNTATRSVTVNSLPNITITPATAVICTGNDTALIAGGGTAYVWASAPFTGSGATIRANPTSATTYTVTGTDANGCSNTATRSVTVNSLPNITITPATATICNGKDTALTANGGISYVWASAPFTGSGATIRANPTSATTYTVTGTDANGCSNTATRSVAVNTLPAVNITGNAALCPNATLQLTGSPTAGTWNSGTTTVATVDNAGLVTGMIPGGSVVSYRVTDVNDCSNTATKSITVYTAPAIPAAITGKTTLCLGDSATLTDATPSGVWSSGTTSVATISAAGKVHTYAVGTTLISYTVSNNTCSTSITANVTVNGLPAAPAALTGATDVCVGATTTLSSTTPSGTWSSSDANIASVQAGNGIVMGMAAGAATIKYTITDGNNCSNSVISNMTVNAKPSATINPAGTVGFCEGDSIILTANQGSNLNYKWMDSGHVLNAISVAYTARAAGYYQVIVTDGNNCTDTSVIDTVIMYALPNPVVTRNGQTLSTGTGYSSYQWYSSGNKVNGATQSSCIVTQSGYYHVVVTDSNGCSKASDIDTVTVGVMNVTNGGISIRIYPNPASNLVHVDVTVPVNVTVISVDGKLLLQQNDTKDIDVSSLASGVYIIKLEDRNGVFIKAEKLLKQ